MKKLLSYLCIALILVGSVSLMAYAKRTSTSLWQISDDNSYVIPKDQDGTTPDIGATADRVPKGWFDDMDTTAITIGGAISGDLILDDGVGDSPNLILRDQGNKNLTLQKLDAGNATINNDEGDIVITATGGDVTFDNENLLTTGTLGAGATTATTLAATAASSLTLGTASAAAGGIIMQNATNANTVTMQSGVTSGSYTMTLPLAVAGAGEVLTDAAGNGTLSWAAGGGSGHLSTIGTGGTYDYLDVQAMIADSQYRGVLMTAVTEDSNVTPDGNGLYLDLGGFTWTVGTYNVLPSANATITVEGSGNTSEIDWTETTASAELFDENGNTGTVLYLSNFTFDNNSSAVNTYLNTIATEAHLHNFIIEQPNVANTGFYTSDPKSTATNITIIGGGASARGSFITLGTASNLYFSGTFDTSNQVFAIASGASVSNVRADASLYVAMAGGSLANYEQSTGDASFVFTGNKNYLTNIDTGSGNIDVSTTDNNLMNNIYCAGVIDMSDASASYNQISNSLIATAITFGGDYNYVTNTVFNSIVVSSGANYNSFDNIKLGATFADSGSYTKVNNSRVAGTFTVNAGGDYGQYSNMEWAGNVSVTSDNARYDGLLNSGITFTINATATDNKADVTIDQTVADSGTSSVISEIVY